MKINYRIVAAFLLGIGIWFAPIPEGLTREAWHLFAIFAAAIFAVIISALPLLTSALLAGASAVLTETLVGASVSKVKSGHPNADVAARAKLLVKKWKKLVIQQLTFRK